MTTPRHVLERRLALVSANPRAARALADGHAALLCLPRHRSRRCRDHHDVEGGVIRRLLRRIAAWHHRQCVKDYEHDIRHHEQQLAGLPAEITRLEGIRKYHVGRAATLAEPRSPVNHGLARAKR